jgi:DNA-binding NtrC family response regulator
MTGKLLLVDDDAAFRRALAGELERRQYRVEVAGTGGEAIRAVRSFDPDVMLLDLRLPDMSGLEVLKVVRELAPATEVIMLTGHGSIDNAIDAIRAGAFDYISKPCALDEMEVRIQRARERQSLHQRATLLERGLTPPDLGSAFVGESAEFRRALALIDRVAPTDSAVLLTGETGSGKEIAAKLVHARSQRRHKPFIVVECAALQETLLQSELFGHERGAFTGADRTKPGLFEVAHGGTIFLDEIGEVSLATQVKLLRVLDTSTFRHVGATTEVRVDVRVIAATNRDLDAMARQGLFRSDLYYRLRTIALRLPPLRERKGDVPLLARHFVTLLNERFGVSRHLSDTAAQALDRHTWPGNVRELLHVVEAAMIVCDGDVILPEHLPPLTSPYVGGQPAAAAAAGIDKLEAVERAQIELALRATRGHRAQAARLLGISERSLYRKIHEYQLEAVNDESAEGA